MAAAALAAAPAAGAADTPSATTVATVAAVPAVTAADRVLGRADAPVTVIAVSYTHLTLPTILLV